MLLQSFMAIRCSGRNSCKMHDSLSRVVAVMQALGRPAHLTEARHGLGRGAASGAGAALLTGTGNNGHGNTFSVREAQATPS